MTLVRLFMLALLVACALASPATAQAVGASLSVSDATVTEGNSGTPTADFTLTLEPTAVPVGVDYATENGTATQPTDYSLTSSSHTFPISLTKQTFTVSVPITPDTADEPDETFKLNLSNAPLATITDAEGIGTIVDDDNDAPTARVDVNPQQAFVGQVIEFNGSRSSDPEGLPLSYAWDLDGNGSFETPTGAESAIGFASFSPGLQALGLKVTDPGNKSDVEIGYALVFPAPAEAARDLTPPATHLFPVQRSLALALRRGLRVRFGCSEACTVAASAGVDRRTGRRVGLSGRGRTIGRGFSAMTKAGSKKFTIKLSRRARRKLAKVRRVRVNLRFKVRDAAGNRRTVNHKITLRR